MTFFSYMTCAAANLLVKQPDARGRHRNNKIDNVFCYEPVNQNIAGTRHCGVVGRRIDNPPLAGSRSLVKHDQCRGVNSAAGRNP
jgi:hypothetical protein